MKKSEKNLKINKINNNAKSFLAKLLATENISVEHKKVKTAYFDVKSRLLVLSVMHYLLHNLVGKMLLKKEIYQSHS